MIEDFIVGLLFGIMGVIAVIGIERNFDFKTDNNYILKIVDKMKTCPECGQRTMELKEEYK